MIYFAPEGILLLPTNTCFDDALDTMGECIMNGDPPEQCTMVHAICLNPIDGTPFAHAWLEISNGNAIQSNLVERKDGRMEKLTFAFPVEEFRAKLRIQKEKRYTVNEAIILNHQTNHYGPWEEDIRALCTARKDATTPFN